MKDKQNNLRAGNRLELSGARDIGLEISEKMSQATFSMVILIGGSQ